MNIFRNLNLMLNNYVTIYAIDHRSGLQIDLGIIATGDQDTARTEAIQIAHEKHQGQKIQVLNTIVIPDNLIDAAYLSRNQ